MIKVGILKLATTLELAPITKIKQFSAIIDIKKIEIALNDGSLYFKNNIYSLRVKKDISLTIFIIKSSCLSSRLTFKIKDNSLNYRAVIEIKREKKSLSLYTKISASYGKYSLIQGVLFSKRVNLFKISLLTYLEIKALNSIEFSLKYSSAIEIKNLKIFISNGAIKARYKIYMFRVGISLNDRLTYFLRIKI